MTDSSTPHPPRHDTFRLLLELAFGTLSDTDPVVVTTNDEMTAHLKHEWRSCLAESAGELPDIANTMLGTAPVLLIPPWSRSSDTLAAAAEGPLRSAHEIAVAGIRPEGDDALLAALLPASALTSPRCREFREIVDYSWQPCLVIFAAGVFDGVHQLFDTAAVFWRPRSSEGQPLKLFRFPGREDEKAVESDFRRLLSRASGTGKFGYVLPGPPGSGESLSIELHDPATTARWSELDAWGATVPMKDLFAFPAPALHRTAHRHLLHDQRQDGSVRVVAARDLRHDGTLAGLDDSSRWAEVPPDRQLRAGDVLLRRMFPPRARGNLVVVEVASEDLPLAADDSVVTLRASGHLGGPQRLVAVLFLRSPLVRKWAVGLSVANLTASVLRDLPIPQPDTALAVTIEGLEAARSQLESWKDESEALLASVFEEESAVTARRRLLESGRQLRMRVDAAALLDDFSHRVRTRYPHPIAYRWSEVQVHLSRGADEAAYEAIVETAEVLLCYTALAVLSLSRGAGLRLGAVDGIRGRLSRGGSHGPGFGDWAAILNEAAESKAFRRVPDGDPLKDFSRVFSDPEAASARQRLAARRNAKSHLRRVDALDLPSAIDEAHADLMTLLEHASFLADLPLVHVTGIRWDTLRGTAEVDYQELMGDNALVPGQQRPYSSSGLEIGSLYLANEDGQLHLLRPFLLRRRCPICRSWETFHVDNTPDASSVTVKSLERGHTDTDPSLRQVLEHVGLVE
ncbi:hypothetical protein FHU28_002352 [Micromonospora echinospora]|uniref:Restriction endonuclease n=1 Tax=Micromonospora echinospora TaxID=1877 RepID=A0ABR6MAW2_MICEC|nr:hypothetical protein [Micromonospora echinospora]MBB5112513.1 hypothetical protein [Micromonospora echinospora]